MGLARLILLIRHCEKNSVGPDLSPTGIEHAKQLAVSIPDCYGTPDIIYAAAPMDGSNRSLETAELIADNTIPVDCSAYSDEYQSLVPVILNRADQFVLVVWRHEELPDFYRALTGQEPPFDPWPEDDFSTQWKIEFGKLGGKAVGNDFTAFLPVTHIGPLGTKMDKTELLKLEASQKMVFGWASTPTRDLQDERVSLDAVKAALPAYMEWANIREMHQPSAVGVCKQADIIAGADKDKEGLYIAAKVVDQPAWEKVVEGVYKGFSIGGQKLAKEGDLVTKINLFEISLVDRPANPDCKIEVWKAAGAEVTEEPPTEEEKVSAGFISKLMRGLGFSKDQNTGDGLSAPANPMYDPNPTKLGRPVIQSPGRGAGDAVVHTTAASDVTADTMTDGIHGGGSAVAPPTGQAGTQIVMPYLGEEDTGWYIYSPDTGKHLAGPYKSIAEAGTEYFKFKKTSSEEDIRCGCNSCEVEKRAWSGKEKNDLPDSAFAYIEPGGDKDDEGKTTPRSLRHFPIKNKSGKLDAPHVRNALARLSHSPHGGKAKAKVESAAEQMGIGEPGADKESALLCLELTKCFGGYFPSTNLSRLAQLWDQLDQLKRDFRFESALEGGNGEDMDMAATLDGIQRVVGGLLAQKAEHEVQEDEEEETEKVLLEAGITQGDIAMGKLFQKRVDGLHKGMIQKAGHHLGKAMTHHAAAKRCLAKTMDALSSLHADDGAQKAAGSGYPMEEVAKYVKAAAAHHQAMSDEMDNVADSHELAKGMLDKVTSSWMGQEDLTDKPARSVDGYGHTDAQSALTEGDVPEYEADEPYGKDPAGKPGKATPEGMEEGVTSKDLMDMAKRIGELEGELKVLRSMPRTAKGTSGDGQMLMKSGNMPPEVPNGFGQVRDALMDGIDPGKFDLGNAQDRSRLVACMLSNMNKSDLFRRDITDPQFRSTRGLAKGMAAMPTAPLIR